MTKAIRIILVAAAAIALTACSSHRKAVAEETTRRVRGMKVAEVGALAQTYSGWETFYSPFTLRCSQPVSMSVSGRATMVRDQYIHLSMRMVGFEVASVYVDQDSVYIADKYHKMLLTEPLTSITAGTGLTVGDIQDILMGRAFYPGQGTLCLVDSPETLFSPVPEGDFIVLMPRRIPGGTSWFFTVDNTPALRRITVEPDGYEPFLVDFSEIVEGKAGAVAQNVMLTGRVGGKEIEAMCQWNLGKAKWNELVNAPSTSFKGYRRITAADLMETLKNNF